MAGCSMTLTLSGPDRLQDELRRDPEFLQSYYLDAQMQLNDQLQSHGVAMVTYWQQSLKLQFCS